MNVYLNQNMPNVNEKCGKRNMTNLLPVLPLFEFHLVLDRPRILFQNTGCFRNLVHARVHETPLDPPYCFPKRADSAETTPYCQISDRA